MEALQITLRNWLGNNETDPPSSQQRNGDHSTAESQTPTHSSGCRPRSEVEEYPPPALEGRVYVDCGFYGFYVSASVYQELQSSTQDAVQHTDLPSRKQGPSFKLGIRKPGFPCSIIGKHTPAPITLLGKHGQEVTVRKML